MPTSGGYYYREGYATSNPSSLRRSKMDFVATKWPRAFMITVTLQAIICLAFEALIFAEFQSNVQSGDTNQIANSQYRSIPTFLTLFIFAFLYELILTWDALRMKNTIQVIGICVANVVFLVYTAIQIDQISTVLQGPNAIQLKTGAQDLWATIRPFLIAMPCVIGLASLFLFFIAWKLYQEFAWDILKQIGADRGMQKRFLHYQIYIALLKFDFFFFLGFTVQFLVIVNDIKDSEFGLTIAAVPVTICILLLAAFFTRRELKLGMFFVILIYFAGLAYFFFKLVRIYENGYSQNYKAVQKSLTAFAVITILLIILTIINAFVCMNNFGSGLKAHILKRDVDPEKARESSSIGLNDVKPQLPSRMTID